MKGGNASGPYVGGLVGFNRGAITASYATGASYTNGASSAYGGLVGESSGTTTASYWNTETSRLVRSASFGWSGGAAVQYRAALTLYRPNYPPRPPQWYALHNRSPILPAQPDEVQHDYHTPRRPVRCS